MISDAELLQLSERVGTALLARRRRLVTAESCTGGWIGKVLTDVAGSSQWYLGGVVSYSDALKESVLGVSTAMLAAHGAVSEATARAMATGALDVLGGDIAVAVDTPSASMCRCCARCLQASANPCAARRSKERCEESASWPISMQTTAFCADCTASRHEIIVAIPRL